MAEVKTDYAEALEVIDRCRVYASAGMRVELDAKMLTTLCNLARLGVVAAETSEQLQEAAEALQAQAEASRAALDRGAADAIRRANAARRSVYGIGGYLLVSGALIGLLLAETLRALGLL